MDFSLEDTPPVTNPAPAVTNENAPKKSFTPYRQTGDSSARKKRISFGVDPKTGLPDVNSLNPDVKEQLKKLITDPEMRKAFGEAGIPIPVLEVFKEEDIKLLYTMVGPVEAYAVAMAMKVPVQLAMQVFLYTPAEIEALTPPTLAVANKYAAYLGGLVAWKEELAFGFALFGVTSAKLATLRHLVSVEKQKEKEANPAFSDMAKPSEIIPPEPAMSSVQEDFSSIIEGVPEHAGAD
jgi:hypothetical protein